MKLQKQDVPFTMVANEVLYRTDLSLKAKGIFAYLFSKPDGWEFAADRIARECKESRKAILTALKELETARLLRREKLGDGRIIYNIEYAESQSPKNGLRQYGLFDPKSQNGTVPKRHGAKRGPISNKESDTNTDSDSKKEIHAGEKPPAQKFSRFDEFTDWYSDLATRARSLKLKLSITRADQSNLGSFLREKKPTWELMEQLSLYFLVNHNCKKLSPDLKTFLSDGVMNRLLNDMQQDPNFWKNLNAYAEIYLRRESAAQVYALTDVQSAVRAMLARMKVSAPADLETA